MSASHRRLQTLAALVAIATAVGLGAPATASTTTTSSTAIATTTASSSLSIASTPTTPQPKNRVSDFRFRSGDRVDGKRDLTAQPHLENWPRRTTVASGSPLAAKGGAGTAKPPNRIYSTRELLRRADDVGPYHNFPGSFDDVIFGQGNRSVTKGFFKKLKSGLSNDSVQYTLRGELNGRSGTYEIFARPSVSGRTEVIMHRFFRPD